MVILGLETVGVRVWGSKLGVRFQVSPHQAEDLQLLEAAE